MKKNITIITIMFLIMTGTISAAGDVLLKIPIRVYKGSEYLKGLSREDFTLKINGKVRTIEEVLTGERSINDISEKRNFILQFNLTDYGKNVTRGINFFINEVLKKRDNLIIWSPLKIYRIRTDKPKQKIISDIEKIVKKDSFSYKRLKEAAGEKLFSIIRTFNNFTPNTRDSSPRISNIITFLNNYSREWLNFKSRFLQPDVGQYYGVFSLLSQKYPGEKYFINFQQREVIPSLKKYKDVKRAINDYLSTIAGSNDSSYSSSIANALKKIDKSFLLSDNFDPEKLVSPFKGANISYNLILFNSFRQSSEDSYSISPDLEGILKNISRATGGFNIITGDFDSGIDSILKKSDNYYFIIYKFNGKKGVKKIKIETDKKDVKLFYKDKFFPEEIDLLIKMASEPGISISDVKISGHDLSFIVSGFTRTGKDKKACIVKVEVKIVDKDRNPLMDKKNTLRAEKDQVNISLKVDPRLKGFFKLQITAKDMHANKEANFSKYIELK